MQQGSDPQALLWGAWGAPGRLHCSAFDFPRLQQSHLPLVSFLGYQPRQGVGSLNVLYSAIKWSCPHFMTLPICHCPQPTQLKSPMITAFSRPSIPALLFYLADCTDPLAGYARLSNGLSHSKWGVKFKGCIRPELLLPWMGLHSLSPPSPSALLFCCSNTVVGTH